MAFFNFRLPGMKRRDDKAAPSSASPDSVEVMRRRARHRLVGAAVLVLIGVVGFPLLFDTQPRPVAVDIPITIPDRNKTAPLVLPGATSAAPVVSGVVSQAPARMPDAAGLDAGEEVVLSDKSDKKVALAPAAPAPVAIKKEAKPEPKPEPKPKPELKPELKPEPKLEPKPKPKPKPKLSQGALRATPRKPWPWERCRSELADP